MHKLQEFNMEEKDYRMRLISDTNTKKAPLPFLRQILAVLELACVKICCERDEFRHEPGSTEKAVSLPRKSTKSTHV